MFSNAPFRKTLLLRLHSISLRRRPLPVSYTKRRITMSAVPLHHEPPANAVEVSRMTDADVEKRYRPFKIADPQDGNVNWVDKLELEAVQEMVRMNLPNRIKILVLYGSLRTRSFSRLTAFEAARILSKLGVDVRVFDPAGLPMKDDKSEGHPKVMEIRALSEWSDGHLWCSPEQHGTVTAVFKNQIDWIPLATGSVRPTQGRTLAICQVNGGSQSFNTVNVLRLLGRWMRMWTIPNQSSIPKAWTQYTSDDRLMPSGNRDRLVDVCEELVKTTILLLPHTKLLNDRFSERMEKRAHGQLRTQAIIEAEKAKEIESVNKPT